MASFPAMILTNKGTALQAKVQSGQLLQFTRMAIGDGELNGTPISGLNALVSQKTTMLTENGSFSGANAYQLAAFFSNTLISTGFWWREWGLFATDPTLGEILYAYSNAGGAGDYIPPFTDSRLEKYLFATVAVGSATNISVTISSGDTFALNTNFVAHMADKTVHNKPVTAGGTASAITIAIPAADIVDGYQVNLKLISDIADSATITATGGTAKNIITQDGVNIKTGAKTGAFLPVTYNSVLGKWVTASGISAQDAANKAIAMAIALG